MEPLSRITPATVDVLDALLQGGGAVWGLRVIKSTGRPAGTVYPILDRLERAGWATSEWEADDERPGPRRRLYALSAEGAVAAAEVVARFETRRAPVASAHRPSPALAAGAGA